MTFNRAMKIVVTDYDPQWPVKFEEEASLIRQIFNNELVDIHHIGSTSVPYLKAKPVIDIMPVVHDIEKVDAINEKMMEIGYEPLGEAGMPGRRYFRKGGENRTHQVHVFQRDNALDINRHIAVREYLRTHPGEAADYGKLKSDLAQTFPADIEGYSAGKDNFVKNLERKAVNWKESRNNMINIRLADVNDVKAIAKVHVDSWRTTYKGIVAENYLNELCYESKEQQWKGIVPNAAVFVAENEKGQIVGFANGGLERSGDYPGYDGELYAIYLLKEFQQQGTGRMLVKSVMDDLSERNIHSMLVFVLEDNPSCAFYEKLGARLIDTVSIDIAGKELNERVYGWNNRR